MQPYRILMAVLVIVISIYASSCCVSEQSDSESNLTGDTHEYVVDGRSGYIATLQNYNGELVLEYRLDDRLIFAVYLDGDRIQTVRSLEYSERSDGNEDTFSVIGNEHEMKTVRVIREENKLTMIYDNDGNGLPDYKSVLDKQSDVVKIYKANVQFIERQSNSRESNVP